MDKAAGVFYEPSKVFGSFKNSPASVSDWLIPLLLLAILIGITVYVKSSSPDLRFQMQEIQEQQIDKRVADGKMTADQAQQAKERIASGSSAFLVIGIFGAIVFTVILFFIAAGVWVLIGKVFLKGNINYNQMMGVAGIASWISIVGVIVSIVMTVLLSRLDGGLHLGMLTQMGTSKTYSLMRSVDLFGVWNLAATSIGIGTLAGKKGFVPAVWVYGTWIVVMLLSVFLLGGFFGG